MAGAGVQKALDKINAQVASGNHYEAQQMYKTVYHRYRSRKQAAEALQILKEGALSQLNHGQLNCGLELGHLLLEAYASDKVEATEEALGRLFDILHALPAAAPTDPAGIEEGAGLEDANRFVMAAIKWAHKQGADAAVQAMHDMFATHIVAAYGWRQLGHAQAHYARGADAEAFATALEQCSSSGRPDEQQYFVCRAVLQTLACAHHPATRERQRLHAQRLLAACQARGLAVDAPLVHFCIMLLQALDRRSHGLFSLLENRYQPLLSRDRTLEALLGRAEGEYFNVQPAGGGGLLGSLLRGMLEADEDE